MIPPSEGDAINMTLSGLNECDAEKFVGFLGGVWEHSPWIASEAAAKRPFATSGELCAAMWCAVRDAAPDAQMTLICAHPDLAGKLARARVLTPESTSEQASAGLDVLTPEERETFDDLNGRYRDQFGFPFIICVRDHDKAGILAAFLRRLEHDRDTEIREALEQIRRIANWRILDLIER